METVATPIRQLPKALDNENQLTRAENRMCKLGDLQHCAGMPKRREVKKDTKQKKDGESWFFPVGLTSQHD
jgi:hypothetical protein